MASAESALLAHHSGRRHVSHPTVSRSISQRSSHAIQSYAPEIHRQLGRYSASDSSDEEVPEPKFSASVRALLDEDGLSSSPGHQSNIKNKQLRTERLFLNASGQERQLRMMSPQGQLTGSPAPRIVHLRSTPPSSMSKRGDSVLSSNEKIDSARKHGSNDLFTPGPKLRTVRINGPRSDTQSPLSTQSGRHSPDKQQSMSNSKEMDSRLEDEQALRTGPSLCVLRSRSGDDPGAHGSLRRKKVGRLTGTFLNGPARRGVLRRQSEENDELPRDGAANGARGYSPNANADTDYKDAVISLPKVSRADPYPPCEEKQEDVGSAARVRYFSKSFPPESYESYVKPTPGSPLEVSSKYPSAKFQPVFKVSSQEIRQSDYDQENMPPPTFKVPKPRGLNFLDMPEKLSVVYGDGRRENRGASTERAPQNILSVRDNNTPHRPAPAPPKMSVLETATASGGAATTSQSRKKRNQVLINHKIFTRLDCIGRGGSSRVYRVMAENYKIFALKRVSLEDVDPVTLAGYKGEIDLLKKLENLDRVVRLFDWEVNHDKKTLSVLMEIGESDLERVLAYRLNTEDAVFDASFTRYYWKEMLECVQAVHHHNIVHSDLKPANFLLVQGRLKLIDFGIANAIQDNTVNVHREQQVGTPNYMSPEALIDSNVSIGLPASAGKLMKLGKKSDVWSLGCILYKMVYGQPPFAKIAKYYERIMAIPNPKVQIDFPSFGVGGTSIPLGLIRTMKNCLQRDQTLRPAIDELLSQKDPFLYPDAQFDGAIPVTQELLSRILQNVVQHCRVHGIPADEELSTWPAGFFEKVKVALEGKNAHL